MPYICLANSALPGGILQITDLWPNESQRVPGIDPPGQNRYLRRPNNDLVGLSGAGPITLTGLQTSGDQFVLEGLAAYLCDRVDPGGAQFATGTITAVGPTIAGPDTITFTGPSGLLADTVTFTAVEGVPAGTITCVAPVATAPAAALTLGTVPFACVQNAATGTFTMNGPLVADTVTIAAFGTDPGVVFTAVESTPIGYVDCDELSVATAPAAALTLGGVDFIAAVTKPTGGQFVMNGVNINDTVTIAGVVFTAKGAENIPAREFDQSLGDNATATSLRACINAVANLALVTTALDLLTEVPTGVTVAAGGAGATVTLIPSLFGTCGQAVLLESTAGVRITKTDFTAPATANPAIQAFHPAAQYVGRTVAHRKEDVSASLTLAINNAATIILMDAANPGPAPARNGHMVAVANLGAVSGRTGLTATQVGAGGRLLLVIVAGAGYVISAGALAQAAMALPASRQFDSFLNAGTNILVATSLVAAINHANARALLTAALDCVPAGGRTGFIATGGTLTAANGGGTLAVVTLTPSILGDWGDATLASTSPGVGGREERSAATMVHTDPNPAVQQFGSALHYGGRANITIRVANSVVAAINDAATVTAMDAANAGPVPTALAGHMLAANGGGTLAGVTCTARQLLPAAANQIGNSGRLGFVTAQAVNLATAVVGEPAAVVLGGNLANPALFQFNTLLNAAGGTNSGVATSIAAVLNNPVTDTALDTTIGGSQVTAVANVAPGRVDVTADRAGSRGAMAVADTAGVRIVVSDNALGKTMVTWTQTQLNAAAVSLQARVDAGSACAVTNINAALNAVGGVTGVSIITGSSTATVADILSIMAGRVYQVPVGSVKDPTGKNWSCVAAGSFTTPNVVYASNMADGEWGAATRWIKHGKERQAVVTGGDTVNNEIAGIRTTVDTTHFASSLQTGQLAHYTSGVVDLFPDAAVRTFVSDWTRRTNRQATLLNQRVVTVFDDDGTLLA